MVISFAPAEDDRPLDEVFEFPDIPGIRVAKEKAPCLLGDVGDRFLILFRVFFQEIVDQERNIPPSLSQRRKMDGNHIEPVVEVLSKRSFLMASSRFRWVAVMTRTSAFRGEVRSHPLEFLLLKDSQKLNLNSRGEIADLIKKDGSTLRLFESTDSSLDCPCEGALFMAEEFALEQGLRNGGAIHLDDGALMHGGWRNGWHWR